jgi:hypothetical protein
MGLASNLFKDNTQLEACLVNHAAHVTRGASGAHVAKIQFALYALDRLQIDQLEIRAQSYGPSTAAAVLAYKRRRRIINYSYETHEDEIVGKMTIASLDNEMRLWERARANRSVCRPGSAVKGPPQGKVVDYRPEPSSESPTGIKAKGAPRFPAILNVYWSITRAGARTMTQASNAHLKYLVRAKEILWDYGISINNLWFTEHGYNDVIPNDDKVYIGDDALRIRKASEDLRPGLPGILRVISCPFIDTSPDYAETQDGNVGTTSFPFFVLINVNKLSDDRATLLHEMIHAADRRFVAHDLEDFSVFSLGMDRHWLRPEHAKALSGAFFAQKGP